MDKQTPLFPGDKLDPDPNLNEQEKHEDEPEKKDDPNQMKFEDVA